MKKNTSKHNMEIKNYEIIRDFIRKLFFMPGFNYDSIKASGYNKARSTYYLDMKRIAHYTDNKIQEYQSENNKYNQIINDLYKYPSNFLLETYRFSSYSINDLQYYFMIMQNMQKEVTTIDSLIDKIKKYYKINDNCYQSIRNKLNELVALGYIKVEKKKGQQYFSLEDDILEYIFRLDLMDKLDLMVLFFHNFYFLASAGYDLLETIRQYQISENYPDIVNHYKKQNDIFLYRYNPIHHVLDNDIVWKILKALNDKKIIEYSYKNQSNKEMLCKIYPIKIITEYDYGRQYIYGFDINEKKYFSNRIDSIYNLHVTDESAYIPENTDKNMQNMWSVSTYESKYNVKIYFDFPKEDIIQYKILKRDLYNTKRFGKITEKDNLLIFEIQVSGYMELVPWINSFGEYALVDKEVCPELYEKIVEHTNELMVLYGLI